MYWKCLRLYSLTILINLQDYQLSTSGRSCNTSGTALVSPPHQPRGSSPKIHASSPLYCGRDRTCWCPWEMFLVIYGLHCTKAKYWENIPVHTLDRVKLRVKLRQEDQACSFQSQALLKQCHTALEIFLRLHHRNQFVLLFPLNYGKLKTPGSGDKLSLPFTASSPNLSVNTVFSPFAIPAFSPPFNRNY